MNDSNIIEIHSFHKSKQFITIEKFGNGYFLCFYETDGSMLGNEFIGTNSYFESALSLNDEVVIFRIENTFGIYSIAENKISESYSIFDVEKVGFIENRIFHQQTDGLIKIDDQDSGTFPPAIISTFGSVGIAEHDGEVCLFNSAFKVQGKTKMDSLGVTCYKWGDDYIILGESRGPLRLFDTTSFKQRQAFPFQEGWNFLEIASGSGDGVVVLSKDFETMARAKVESIDWRSKEEIFVIEDAPIYLRFCEDHLIGSNRKIYDVTNGEILSEF